jgi:hypothetical protein
MQEIDLVASGTLSKKQIVLPVLFKSPKLGRSIRCVRHVGAYIPFVRRLFIEVTACP